MNDKSGNKKIFIIIIVFALVIFGSSLIYSSYKPNKDTPVATTDTDPVSETDENKSDQKMFYDFKAMTADSKTVSLSDYIGKSNIVLNFWASWCPPCIEEMPDFLKLEEEYLDKDVTFVMVNLTDGTRETMPKAKKFLKDSSLDFKNVLFDTTTEAAYNYSVNAIPTTVFINKAGVVVSTHTGLLDKDSANKLIDELID